MRGSLARGRDLALLFPMRSKLSWLLGGAELERVAAPGPVDDVAGDLEHREDLAQSRHIAASLFWEEVGPRPGLAEDLLHGEEPVGMIEQELEELKFSSGERCLQTPEANRSTLGIELRAVEIRQATVPQVEPFVVAEHLTFDDHHIRLRRLPGDRWQLSDIAPDALEDSLLELDEIGIDAHPVARVFPV